MIVSGRRLRMIRLRNAFSRLFRRKKPLKIDVVEEVTDKFYLSLFGSLDEQAST
jgi:hypothetical protein